MITDHHRKAHTMSDTALVSRLPKCDFGGDHLASYDFKTKQGPWANGCEAHWIAHRFYSDLGTGKGQHLVFVHNDFSYRGYKLGLMRTGDVIILHRGDHIDTAGSLEAAESRIDSWLEGK